MTLVPGERLVIDASVAIKWVIAEPGNDRASVLLDYATVAPDLLFAECAHILWRKLRQREISVNEALTAARTLERGRIYSPVDQNVCCRCCCDCLRTRPSSL